jgi:predicted amidophosphoribosyltransferase
MCSPLRDRVYMCKCVELIINKWLSVSLVHSVYKAVPSDLMILYPHSLQRQEVSYIMLDYYATKSVRDVCHSLKKGERSAAHLMAKALSLSVSDGDIIIPTPNSNGEPGVMGLVCDLIARSTGCTVWSGLRGDVRESVYNAKKRGVSANDISVAFRLDGKPPIAPGETFIVDGVWDTGTTLSAASSLLPGAKVLAFARVNKHAELDAERLVVNATPMTIKANMKELALLGRDVTAFSFVRLLIRERPDDAGHIIDEAVRHFADSAHYGLKEGLAGEFLGGLALPAKQVALGNTDDKVVKRSVLNESRSRPHKL